MQTKREIGLTLSFLNLRDKALGRRLGVKIKVISAWKGDRLTEGMTSVAKI